MLRYRRRLPHVQPEGAELFLTWRLHGSPPPPTPTRGRMAGQEFALHDRALERDTSGPLWLRRPDVAACVVETLREGEEWGYCRLHAWVVMANHVHVLLTPHRRLPDLMRFLKGQSARRANVALGRGSEPVWAHEFYDHWVRSDDERARIYRYIVCNPVKAGLVERPQDWPWSSVAGVEELRP